MVEVAAKLAAERRKRGVKLNLPEATALIASFLLEGARDGRAKADLQDASRQVLGRDDVMDGVPETLTEVQVEATFPDGAKLIVVQEPISTGSGTRRRSARRPVTASGSPTPIC